MPAAGGTVHTLPVSGSGGGFNSGGQIGSMVNQWQMAQPQVQQQLQQAVNSYWNAPTAPGAQAPPGGSVYQGINQSIPQASQMLGLQQNPLWQQMAPGALNQVSGGLGNLLTYAESHQNTPEGRAIMDFLNNWPQMQSQLMGTLSGGQQGVNTAMPQITYPTNYGFDQSQVTPPGSVFPSANFPGRPVPDLSNPQQVMDIIGPAIPR